MCVSQQAYTEVGVSEEVDAAAPETREAAYKLVNKVCKYSCV